jgi:hypothetical protein
MGEKMQAPAITNELLDAAQGAPESELLVRCFKQNKHNTNPDVVAMKMALMEFVDPTLSPLQRREIDLAALSYSTMKMPNLDARIAKGDPTVVNDIAMRGGGKHLLPFAAKFCCYQNRIVYGRDDYLMYTPAMKRILPAAFNHRVSAAQLQRWQDEFGYDLFMNCVAKCFYRQKITTEKAKQKLEKFVLDESKK